MKWRILISAPYMLPVIDQYRGQFEANNAEIIVTKVNERLSEQELLGLMGEIDGVIAGDDRFTRKVLECSVPRLKVISKWGTGIDAFDLEACNELGVRVCNTPGAFTKPVADSVLAYILSFARKIPWMHNQMKRGIWEKIPGRSLSECTLGIIGFGNIGRAVAKRASGFQMTILANDIQPIDPQVLKETNASHASLECVLRESDFVSVNCDLNPSSHHLIDTIAFTLMKETAVLINMARGPIVHEDALIQALKSKEIAGAALDVYEHEPLPQTSELLEMSNVLLAPHNSNSSPTAWLHVHENSIKNLFSALKGSI